VRVSVSSVFRAEVRKVSVTPDFRAESLMAADIPDVRAELLMASDIPDFRGEFQQVWAFSASMLPIKRSFAPETDSSIMVFSLMETEAAFEDTSFSVLSEQAAPGSLSRTLIFTG
jgi:hypothetical protein